MARFKPNPAFKRELRAQPEFQAGMRAAATAGAAAVRAAAPRGTGAYRRSVSARGNLVVTTDAFWHLVEFGSINNPPYAPLRRGIRVTGLRLDLNQTDQ